MQSSSRRTRRTTPGMPSRSWRPVSRSTWRSRSPRNFRRPSTLSEGVGTDRTLIQIGLQRRFDQALLHAKRLLDAGLIGSVREIRSILRDQYPPPSDLHQPRPHHRHGDPRCRRGDLATRRVSRRGLGPDVSTPRTTTARSTRAETRRSSASPREAAPSGAST